MENMFIYLFANGNWFIQWRFYIVYYLILGKREGSLSESEDVPSTCSSQPQTPTQSADQSSYFPYTSPTARPPDPSVLTSVKTTAFTVPGSHIKELKPSSSLPDVGLVHSFQR